jgi:hypothetical protein
MSSCIGTNPSQLAHVKLRAPGHPLAIVRQIVDLNRQCRR